MKQLLNKRGYLITNVPVKQRSNFNMQEWTEHTFAHLYIYTDSLLNYISYKNKSTAISCIGIVIDPINHLINSEQILKNCIHFLHESQDRFWDYIDTLGGRFIFILKTDKQTIVFQDAVGTRSLHYYNSETQRMRILISSHSELIAEIKALTVDEETNRFLNDKKFRNDKDRYYPGLFTPYKDILALTPNTYLNINTNKIKRFFPRKSWSSEQHLFSTDTLSLLLENQLKLLNEHYDLAISLTGGLDSRLTLAASKEIKHSIYYYTMIYGSNHKSSIEDARVAKELAGTFHLDHHILRYDQPADPDFIKVFKKNTSGISSDYRAKIAETLYHTYPQNRLHIKSNIVDMSKAHYRTRFAFLPNKCNVNVFSKLYNGYSNMEYVNKSMQSYIDRTHLDKQRLYDYDLYDLFYWEHRQGKWQSLCLYEWDIVQDTAIIYNNRSVLKPFLFQSTEDKKNGNLHKKLIKSMWAELLDTETVSFGTLRWKPLMRIMRGLSTRCKLLFNRA